MERIDLFKEIFNKDYQELLDYTKSILNESKEKCIILMGRRWFIVFEIICNFFGYDTTDPKILCDDDISRLKSHHSQIIISDDIIIHGRTVMDLYKKLSCRFNEISITAFLRRYNAEVLDLSKYVPLDDDYPVTDFEWRDLSNRLINFIIRSKVPYTTFTYSFVTQYSAWENDADFLSIVVKPKIFNDNNIDVIVHFDQRNRFILLSTLCKYVCIREYKYPDGTTIYIPFVFINVVNNSVFESIALAGKSILPKSIISVLEDKADFDINYKARLLSFILSYAYGRLILTNKTMDVLDNGIMPIINSIISKSFTSTFNDVISLDEGKCRLILNLNIGENNSSFGESINDVKSQFYSFNINDYEEIDASNVLSSALSKLHEENEKRALQNANSTLWGYKVIDLIDGFKLKSNIYYYLADLISLWDTGKGSYYFQECGDFTFGTVSDGEQAYRIKYEKYGVYASSYFLLRKYLNFDQEKEYINDYMNYIKRQIPECYNLFSKYFIDACQFFKDKISLDVKEDWDKQYEVLLFNNTMNYIKEKYKDVIK